MSDVSALIAEARELCAKASPGPWYFTSSNGNEVEEMCYVTTGDGDLDIDAPVLSPTVIGEAQAQINWDFCGQSRRLVPELADALASAQERIARLESQEQGTPLGRLNAMGEFAEKRCGHAPLSARPFECSIIEHIDKLEERIAELESAFGLSLDAETGRWLAEGGDMVASAATPEQAAVNLLRVLGLQWKHYDAVRVQSNAHIDALESRLSQAREALRSWDFTGNTVDFMVRLLAILNGTEAQQKQD